METPICIHMPIAKCAVKQTHEITRNSHNYRVLQISVLLEDSVP